MNRHHVHTRFRRARANAAQPEPEGVARLRAELADKSRRLEETLLNLDNLVSPLDWLDAGDGFPGFGSWRFNRPASRAQDLTHAPLAYLNEEEWRTHVALARDLVTRNHLALGFRDHVSNFVGPVAVSFVLKGQAPGSSGGSEETAVDPLVRDCTAAWDEWRELAEWGEGEEDREAECRQRLIVEGECTLRFFKGDAHSDGLPYVRHVEPELIRTPPDHTTSDSWGWGVRTAENDDERELGLWLCDALNVSEGRVVESGDYVRVKANVDRTVKRGLSDIFPVAEHLRKVLGLLDNMGHVARLQAAIAWWEQYPAATFEQVQNQIRAGADYTRPKLPPGAGGASTDVTSYEAGTVVRTEAGHDVKPGPIASGVSGFAQVEALLLRGVGFRWGCPGYFSGDADASFASVLVTGSPFVRITEARQEKLKGFAKSVATRVLEFCEKTGRLPKGASKRVRPVATSRPVVIADEEKQARTFLSLYQQNVADPVEFIRERGGDPKVVAANIAAWQKKFPPPGGDMSGGTGDPSATPPGSAGGDGSSPNDDPMGDAYAEAREPCACEQLVHEGPGKPGSWKGGKQKGKTGTFRDKDGNKYCLRNGVRVKCPNQAKVKAKGPPGKGGPNMALATPVNSKSVGGAKTSGSQSTGGGKKPPPPGGGKTPPSGGSLKLNKPGKSPLKNWDKLTPGGRQKALEKFFKAGNTQGLKDKGQIKDAQRVHLSKLPDKDLIRLVDHYAKPGPGRTPVVKEWASTANEVLLNRLTGGRLQGGNATGWDNEMKNLVMNYKLITNRGYQDGFDGTDAMKVYGRYRADQKKRAFVRVTTVSVDGDPDGKNGLYIHPGVGREAYGTNQKGKKDPIRVATEAEFKKDPTAAGQELRRKLSNLDKEDIKKRMGAEEQGNLKKSAEEMGGRLVDAGKRGKDQRKEAIDSLNKNLKPTDLVELVAAAVGKSPGLKKRLRDAINNPTPP